MTKGELLERHARITTDLIGLHTDLGQTLGAERRAKVRTFAEIQGSEKVRDNAAAFNSLDLTSHVFELRGQIDAAQAELDDIRLQLAYGTFT